MIAWRSASSNAPSVCSPPWRWTIGHALERRGQGGRRRLEPVADQQQRVGAGRPQVAADRREGVDGLVVGRRVAVAVEPRAARDRLEAVLADPVDRHAVSAPSRCVPPRRQPSRRPSRRRIASARRAQDAPVLAAGGQDRERRGPDRRRSRAALRRSSGSIIDPGRRPGGRSAGRRGVPARAGASPVPGAGASTSSSATTCPAGSESPPSAGCGARPRATSRSAATGTLSPVPIAASIVADPIGPCAANSSGSSEARVVRARAVDRSSVRCFSMSVGAERRRPRRRPRCRACGRTSRPGRRTRVAASRSRAGWRPRVAPGSSRRSGTARAAGRRRRASRRRPRRPRRMSAIPVDTSSGRPRAREAGEERQVGQLARSDLEGGHAEPLEQVGRAVVERRRQEARCPRSWAWSLQPGPGLGGQGEPGQHLALVARRTRRRVAGTRPSGRRPTASAVRIEGLELDGVGAGRRRGVDRAGAPSPGRRCG